MRSLAPGGLTYAVVFFGLLELPAFGLNLLPQKGGEANSRLRIHAGQPSPTDARSS
jgi:hypothetical protein